VSFDPDSRKAWLEAGGFIAGGDGLSGAERDELSASAAGPDLSRAECEAIIARGAAAKSLPAHLVTALASQDIALRLDIIANVLQAVSVDGLSEAEHVRFCEVAGAAFGAARVDAVVRYCRAAGEAVRLRAAVVLGA
jgi:hypothetical protein